MQVYTGEDARSTREINQGSRVVCNLVEYIEKCGRNNTSDNLFTMLSLA